MSPSARRPAAASTVRGGRVTSDTASRAALIASSTVATTAPPGA
ncbi:hypothetical protein ACFXKG_27490 [Streptomyces sp. NPDC059255]